MEIERAKISDAEEILSLQKLAYISEAKIYDCFNIPPLVQTLEELRDDFKNQLFLKTVIDSRIIGSVRAFAKEGTCFVGRLIVHPDYQNQGIGSKLMQEIERIFKTSKRFELFTGHKSEGNLYLYQKLGYKIFKTEKVNDKVSYVYLEKKNEEMTTIRPANSSDTRAIAVILRELGWFAHVNAELPAAAEERISRHLELCSAEESHLVLVAENQNGEVVGYVAVHWLPYLFLAGPEGYVSELFIRESERGKGIGRELLEAVKDQAVKRGCVRLMLVNGRHRPSYERSFYEKLGWQERPEAANFVLPLLFESG